MMELHPFSREQFDAFCKRSLPEYAQDLSRTFALPMDLAFSKAKASFDELLPGGWETPGNFFRAMIDETGAQVGELWYLVREKDGHKSLFIADICVAPDQRGKSYGSQAIRWLESEGRRLGIPGLSLHVFGHNKRAIKLYESLGFEPFSMYMRKSLV